jgi:hypothetical protein
VAHSYERQPAESKRRDAPATPKPASWIASGNRSGGRVLTPSPAQTIALQQAAGNRAATRALARWAAHPDKDKKGELMPDEVAAEYERFNPPKNS